MPEEANILHADVDAFFASVEQRDDPSLRGRPVLVGPGVVMAASYEARARGVRGGMGATQARRLCPNAVAVAPRWPAYVEASREIFGIFKQSAPLVEGLSMEEAFLDVRGLGSISGSPPEIAARLREDVRERVGLAISVGVARTKVIAKMASGAAKPDGLLVIRPGEELAFLHPLRVERVWGVGAVTARKLRAHGIATVGQIAQLPVTALMSILGPAAGRRLHAIAHNHDPRPVRAGRRRRSFGAQRALGRSSLPREGLDTVVAGLVDRVTRRMRKAGRVGRTVVLRLRFRDFSRATRSRTLARATAETTTILVVARALLAAAMPAIDRRGLTLVGVAVANVERDGGGVQLALPLHRAGYAIDAAIDELRDRFGPDAITRGVLMGGDPSLSAALLPGDGPGELRDA